MKLWAGLNSLVVVGVITTSGVLMSGCNAMQTAIKKSDLEVASKMSESIFLEPVSPKYKTIYTMYRNTSDKDVSIQQTVNAALINKGFTITDDPEQANFMLQANTLYVEKADLREAQSALAGGFGGAIAGVAIAGAAGGDGRDMAAGGLIGAATGFIGDALVEDIMFMMVTDIELRERPLKGEIVTQTQNASLQQGSATHQTQVSAGTEVDWKKYRTRVVSTANQMNLHYEEAQEPMTSSLARSISGLF